MRYMQSYRRSPYSIIVSRWKRHVIHILAIIGVVALAYALLHVPAVNTWGW